MNLPSPGHQLLPLTLTLPTVLSLLSSTEEDSKLRLRMLNGKPGLPGLVQAEIPPSKLLQTLTLAMLSPSGWTPLDSHKSPPPLRLLVQVLSPGTLIRVVSVSVTLSTTLAVTATSTPALDVPTVLGLSQLPLVPLLLLHTD